MAQEITPDAFTVDYTGTPGKRAFFVQARSEAGLFTLGVEKEQVAALAEKLAEMLLLVDREDDISSARPARDPELTSTPMEPEWRIGAIGLGYEDSLDMVAILFEPITGEEQPAEAGLEGETLRVMLRRDQARAFALHALAVVAEGRPLCQLCGLPMDPEGHICPASNGHKTFG